ncbi:hypothetical protein KEM48_001945 [Puccinia striiformis f. sp. tritici PST-130]|nr:hypothetical protein KEM48_001945 [Puccinia striiformis f. sp. tritici PST-130]
MMLANSELESETSRLETLGIVNESNRMSIADLLNPAGETQDVGLLSSEEIFELHQEAQAIDNKNPKTEPDPCGNIIRVLQLTTKEDHHWARIAEDRKRILGHQLRVLPTIDASIICASGTEFDIIQDQWRDPVRSMDGELRILMCMLDPREATYYQPLTEPEIQLGKSLVPVLKLSRVFLKKFYRIMGGSRFPLFTIMSSDQLDTFGGLADNIEGRLGGMIADDLRDLSNKAEEGGDSEYLDRLMKEAAKLEKYSGAGLLLILIHFLPIIPDSDGYKDWLFVWQKIFELHQEAQAIDNKNPETKPDPVPKPTLREIRSALATTFNYIHHDNSPLADELQNLLDRYSQQIDSTSIKNAQQLLLDSFFKTSSN